jgi:hypothetical protein
MTYPPNGTVTHTYEVSDTEEVKMKGFIISSSILMVIFAVLSIIFLIQCKRVAEEEDLVDNELRKSIVDLETSEAKDNINPSSMDQSTTRD